MRIISGGKAQILKHVDRIESRNSFSLFSWKSDSKLQFQLQSHERWLIFFVCFKIFLKIFFPGTFFSTLKQTRGLSLCCWWPLSDNDPSEPFIWARGGMSQILLARAELKLWVSSTSLLNFPTANFEPELFCNKNCKIKLEPASSFSGNTT